MDLQYSFVVVWQEFPAKVVLVESLKGISWLRVSLLPCPNFKLRTTNSELWLYDEDFTPYDWYQLGAKILFYLTTVEKRQGCTSYYLEHSFLVPCTRRAREPLQYA